MKIGCVFLHISNHEGDNYQKDNFFAYNAINSFKKWHPDIDIHHITNDNFNTYLTDLNITEYYDAVGLIRIYIIKELLSQKGYDKIIMLGLDTFTCSYLDEFINNNEDDLICSSGPPYDFLKTDYWAPKIVNGDVDFINADVACFNNWEAANMLINKSIEFWTNHSEQGGMNYIYQNQNSLNIKVSIVDFPYNKSNSLYNIRSKGIACGGNQMYKGKLYSGNYKDPNSVIIGDIYPTSIYYVKDDKLYTSDHKQIKVFHYAEALGAKTKDEYNNVLDEIKYMWFNEETKEFLKLKCNCIFE
jgi:hypothetical protein